MKTSSKVWRTLRRSARPTSIFITVVVAYLLLPASRAQAPAGKSTDTIEPTITAPVVATVTVGPLPVGLVVSPDSKLVYVADLSGISVIDTATNQVTSTISVNGQPSDMAMSKDGATLYCTENQSNAVLQISTATRQVTATFATGSSPQIPAVSPTGTLVYIPSASGLDVISNGQLQSPIVLPGAADFVVFTPDGSHAYVDVVITSHAGLNAHPVLVIIDTATRTITSTTKIANFPFGGGGMLFSSDATKLYITGLSSASTPVVGVLDTANNKITKVIQINTKLDDNPGLAGITPDGKYLFVPFPFRLGNPEKRIHVDIVDLVTQKPLRTAISVGYSPLAVAVAPNGTYAYTANYNSGTVSVLNVSSE